MAKRQLVMDRKGGNKLVLILGTILSDTHRRLTPKAVVLEDRDLGIGAMF